MSRRLAVPAAALRLIVPLAALLQGCSSMSGLDAGSGFSCKAPAGVQCASVSGVYYNALENNLPSQRRPAPAAAAAVPQAAPVPAAVRTPAATHAAAGGDDPTEGAIPLRAGPRVLRLWIKAWEDADRDLVGDSLVYVQVDDGRWLVDHVKRQPSAAFARVRTPLASPGATTAAPVAGGTAGTATARVPLPAGADDPASVSQALRAFQGRPQAPGQ